MSRISLGLGARMKVGVAGGGTPWYLAGDVPLASVVAAYAPAGAASLAASYSNIANPGTNDAAPGTAPTWDATNGWKFDAASLQYLLGPTVGDGYSAVIKFTNGPTAASGMYLSVRTAAGVWGLYTTSGLTTTFSSSGSAAYTATPLAACVLAVVPGFGYVNGAQRANWVVSTPGITGPVGIGAQNRVGVNINTHVSFYVQKLAIYNAALTPAQVEALSVAMNGSPFEYFLPYGDSKTAGDEWPNLMIASEPQLVENPLRIAVSGRTTAQAAAALAAELAAANGTPAHILYNLGVNDALNWGTVVEADWKTQTAAIWDAMHAKWPAAKIYVMYPWCAGQDANCDTLAGWFDTVRAGRGWVLPGPDERIWLEGGNNGATMTTDGTHYSAAGEAECAAQWLAVLP